MAMTQAQALSALRERLDESSSAAWTDAELRRWLNEGVEDICRRAECLQTTGTQAVVAGTQTYTLTTRIVRLYRVEFKPTGDSRVIPLEYRDFNAMDSVWWTNQAITSNHPAFYTLWGFPGSLKLVLYPTPATAGTLNLHYYAVPTPLATDGTAASTNLELPVGWETAAIDYAEYMALRKDMQPRWVEAKTLYEERLDSLITMSRRWTDQAGVIDPHTGAGGTMGLPAWLVNG